jgi:hypothetical protein
MSAPENRLRKYLPQTLATMPPVDRVADYIRTTIRGCILNSETLYHMFSHVSDESEMNEAWADEPVNLNEFAMKFRRDIQFRLEHECPGFNAEFNKAILSLAKQYGVEREVQSKINQHEENK